MAACLLLINHSVNLYAHSKLLQSIYNNRIVVMCDHESGLDGTRAAGPGGEQRAGIDGSGGGGGVAYEAREYKQGWADERAGRRASRRRKSSILRHILTEFTSYSHSEHK